MDTTVQEEKSINNSNTTPRQSSCLAEKTNKYEHMTKLRMYFGENRKPKAENDTGNVQVFDNVFDVAE